MQKADGSKADALVASEVAALLIMAMLPYFRRCYKESLTKQQFALRCRYLESCLGLPLFSVQNPFTISMDNANTHPQSRKMASYMWQEHLDARAAWDAVREQLFTKISTTWNDAMARVRAAAAAQLNQQSDQQQSGQQANVQRAANSVQPGAQQAGVPVHDRIQLHLPAVAPLQGDTDYHRTLAEILVALSHAPVAGEETKLTQWARAHVEAVPGGKQELAELAARAQAYDDICDSDPTACGYASQQFLSLEDKTPDINSGAENCVFFHKQHVHQAVLDWMFDPDMDDDLELAATYWDKCKERTAWLNSPNGLVTCEATVINALARVKLIAAPKNEQIKVIKATVQKPENGPYSIVLREAEVTGSGGGWIAQGVYSG